MAKGQRDVDALAGTTAFSVGLFLIVGLLGTRLENMTREGEEVQIDKMGLRSCTPKPASRHKPHFGPKSTFRPH